MPTLAYDRSTSTSSRYFDADGRLHVRSTISRAQVDNYLAEEIPNWEALGLRRGTLVPMFRPPAELKAATPAFDGIPLLSKHVAVTAAAHRPDLVVGVVVDPAWEAPDLVAKLIVWDGDAIRCIEEMDERGAGQGLSCGYRYEPRMMAGSDGGQRYAGMMCRIVPNHCALVATPRVANAVVGDSALLRRTALDIAPGLARIGVGPVGWL